ncbi:MAG: TIM barrel protein [Thermoplasmata archaeon]|nr:TIM barrel protein [Thermoplasmata archaeon]
MIRFGPAGIPLSCKGRTLRDGIADVHHLGLTAMEVQFIKVNPLTRLALDEEVGKAARDLVQQLVVSVGPGDLEGGTPTAEAFAAPIRRKDSLTALTWSLAKDYADLEQTKALARSLDVDLTLHAPYYVDFFGSTDARQQSTRQIQWAGVLAHGLGARLAVTHLGFYGTGDRSDSIQALTEIVTDLSGWFSKFTKGKVRLAIEPSGHPDVFGSREEVLELAHRTRGSIIPVLNLPHLAARERRSFEEPDDLDPVLREFVKATDGPLYLNFSGVEFYGPGEFRLTPIKRGLVRFDPLAELLAERDYDVSVISSSPLLEHDAMYMKLLYERALARRWTKLHPSAAKPGARAPLPPPEKARRPGTAAPPEKARPAGARPPARPAPRARPHPMPKAVKRKPPAKGGDRGRRRRH